MASFSADAKLIIVMVRSIVNSRKQPCQLNEVIRDYRELEGAMIPAKKFGYNSVEEFLKESGEFVISNVSGETCIAVKTTSESAHITSMVRSQKSGKVRKKSGNTKPGTNKFRQPIKSDQSWNKSTFSSNVYSNKQSNNYSHQSSRNKMNQNQQKRSGGHYNNSDRNNNSYGTYNQKNKVNNTRQQQNQSSQKQQIQPLMQIQTQLPSDLRHRLNAKKGQSQEPNNPNVPRPILGQNNVPINYSMNVSLAQQRAVAEVASIVASKLVLQQKYQQKSVGQIQPLLTNNEVDAIRNSKSKKTQNYQKNNKSGASVQNRLKIRFDSNDSGNCADSDSNTPESTPSTDGNDSAINPFQHNREFNRRTSTPQKHKFIPPEHFQFNPDISAVISLQQYCIVRRFYRPEYKCLKMKFSKMYQCQVMINGNMYSTYPDEFATEESAREACSLRAIEEIKALEARNRYPLCTDSEYELILKIFQQIKNHLHGIFAKNFNEWFESVFEQRLPDNWFSLIQGSDLFYVEESATSVDNMIIFANSRGNEGSTSNSSGNLCNTSSEEFVVLEKLNLPWEEKYWNLHITHCRSTVEVWARLVGPEYSQKFDNLMTDIDLHMMTNKVRPSSIICNQIYLICLSECWHRVRVEELDRTNGKCLCFFIDFGDEEWIQIENVYACESKFLNLPPQGIAFSLFGLEDFSGNRCAKRHLDELLCEKCLVGEILTKRDIFDKNTGSSENENDAGDYKIQVVLYDTSSNEDINLNAQLMKTICDDTQTPELKKSGVTNANITHVVDKTGEIYIQIRNSDLIYVLKLIQQLIESKFKEEQHKVSAADLKQSSIFLVRNAENSRWYRAQLANSNTSNTNELEMFYVDYGWIKKTNISQIFRLESLSTALTKYPKQALKVKMANLPKMNSNIIAKIRGFLPLDTPAIVKMTLPALVPEVMIYKRFENNQNLFNVNECIRIEEELESTDDSRDPLNNYNANLLEGKLNARTNSLLKTTALAVNYTNSKDLPKLEELTLPKPNDFFDVVVAMSANPFNFTVQSYDDYPKLMTMMNEIQDHCENDEYIPGDMIEVGQAYAGKHADGYYHRCVVETILDASTFHVSFCDFGDVSVLTNDKLKTLPTKFRSLPKQAVQARLHGIKPKNIDWTLEDCIHFKDLTVGKTFVSSIVRISNDNLSPNVKVLELQLIDTRSDNDIFIHQLLVEEGRAILN